MINVRRGTFADIDACLNIDTSFPNDHVLTVDISSAAPEHDIALRWESTKPAYARRRHTYSREDLTSDIENAVRFWVLEIDDVVSGYALLRRIDWQPETGDIAGIYVDARQRRQGAGTALVEGMKSYAREESLRGIFWEAQTDNYDAISFALHHGFRFAGLNIAFYSNSDHLRQRQSDFTGIAVFLFWENDMIH